MTADEFLSQIKKYDMLIDNKLGERHKLWCLATKITVPTDREVVQTSGVSDKVGNIAAKLVDLENEIDSLIDDYINIQRDCIGVIEKLVDYPVEYRVIHKRYVLYRSFAEIACEENYSLDGIMKIRRRALRRIEAILKERNEKISEVQKCI